MRIKQNVTGETADFLAWNLSTNEHPSYVLVRLDNGSLYEWKIDGCSIVAAQTSEPEVAPRSTSDNTSSPKLPATCYKCLLVSICKGYEVIGTDLCVEARMQLLAFVERCTTIMNEVQI